jgi:NAD(P)H-dependent flavin oxidoreductase YrpB (nitropropane dioxygenase family)
MVITGNEGGGHQSYEKVSSLVLLQQVTQKYPDIPIAACGGYANGQALAAVLAMGAGAMVMGSRFIASKESEFHQAIKDIIPPAKAQDTVLVTGGFGPIRLWKNKYSLTRDLVSSKEEKMAQEAQTSTEELVEQSRKYELAYRGNVNDGAVLVGQSIGIINEVKNVPDIIDDIVKTAEHRIKTVFADLI